MNSLYDKWRIYQYYAIIGIISLIALLFLPMIGSEAGLEWQLPTTIAGWTVYVITKLMVATINILIFHCFVQQAKVNCRDNENYKHATELLMSTNKKEFEPRSPHKYLNGIYGKKGTTIFITSVLSVVGLTQAVLTFDWVSMLTYLFTIIVGVIFGILVMNSTEEYWCNEYLAYAKMIVKREEISNNDKDRR